ncbi:hypothetical protein DFH11DRAFT_498541 [Phellopilus nigrolimitatus]|nr:hypothetical protein DFH11DRAFT_498541 [Phellopilus nigrolimitatus]
MLDADREMRLQRLTPRLRSRCSIHLPTSRISLRSPRASGGSSPATAAWSALSASCVIFVSPRRRQRTPPPLRPLASWTSPPAAHSDSQSQFFDRHAAYGFPLAFQSVVNINGSPSGAASCRRARWRSSVAFSRPGPRCWVRCWSECERERHPARDPRTKTAQAAAARERQREKAHELIRLLARERSFRDCRGESSDCS